MTETILALVPTYGLPFLFGMAILAAIGVPISSSLAVLVAGAFIASGDLPLVATILTALIGAVIGDQIGYQIGRRAGTTLEVWLTRKPSLAKHIKKSNALIHRYGGVGVFLTRWLISPIGPITNVVCGANNMVWLRFSIWAVLGEIIWATIYIGFGYAFQKNLVEIASLLGQASWLLIVALVAIGMGLRLIAVMRQHKREG